MSMANQPLPEQGTIDQELLQLLAQQGRRVPYPAGFSAVLIAAMAMHGVSPWLSGVWLLLALGTLSLRWWLLGRLPEMRELPLAKRMRWAQALSLLYGLVFGASLGFTPFITDYERMVQTILLLGMAAGSVATTAGYWPVLRAVLIPVTLANALGWLTGGGVHRVSWIEVGLGALIIGFGLMLMSMARDANRVFVESVLIRLQQIKSNQQLRVALQQAESAMQAKTRFLAAASHDLRQPMHTLSLFGAALMRRPLDAQAAEISRQMNVALQSLATQMDALLDISKLDAQVVAVHSHVFALCPWLQRLCDEALPAAQAKGLSLSLDCPREAFVETDPLLLERVLRNLLDNAIKYTSQGLVQLNVEREDEVWRIRVRDSGCGIAEAEQTRVFEEFYQIDNPERDRARGLGLGLSIVSRLVDLLDLTLTLESEPGQGSVFSLRMAAAAAAMPAQTAAPPGEALLPALLHVLVIDDEESVRAAMLALLSAHGCDVTVAGTTRDAVVKSLQRRPDIVLSDLRLRGAEDGISAVRSLRGALPGLPALLVSGDTAPERLREAHEAGLMLLHKPVQEETLLRAMKAALTREPLSAGPATASTVPQS
jgi:signal transduction histidine kinase/ActR/RegA family two-component response regulator